MADLQAPEVTRRGGLLGRWLVMLTRPSLLGVAVGLALFSVSLTPSLVPRSALFLGLLGGLWAAIGYLMGAALGRWLTHVPTAARPRRARLILARWRAAVQRQVPPPMRRFRHVILVVAAAIYAVVFGSLVVRWQNGVRILVEMEPLESTDILLFAGMTIVGCVAGLLVGAGLGWVRRRVRAAVSGRGRRFAGPSGFVAAMLVAVSATAVLVLVGMGVVERLYGDLNAQTPDGATPPLSDLRSGGPGSTVAWEGLGRHGRGFIGSGPDAALIETVTGRAAQEPVRVYVGMDNAGTLEERARIAVSELRRTGGFDRSVLVVATPTGSGWLEAQAVDSVEYLYGGDTAIVSLQYSYLPSWASVLFDSELPVNASRALFDAVHAEWESMPAADRPRLAVYGLSLGALGMQSALGDLVDIREKSDAALFVGAPNNSQPWRDLQQDRDAGSPEWQPILNGGAEVRWLSKPGDFDGLPATWQVPRVAYLQHATDAVTWMDPEVIWRRPGWLAGPAAQGGRGADVSDAMVWFPGVTYLHLVADMILGVAVPAGHGHNFGDVMLDGWAGVLPGHALDDEAMSRVQTVIESYARDVEDPFWE